YRARIAVRDNERQRMGFRRTGVQKVDALAIDLSRELRECVQLRLLCAPVIGGAPILGQPAEVTQRHASAPADSWPLVGPTGRLEAPVQVIERGLGNGYGERLDTRHHCSFWLCGLPRGSKPLSLLVAPANRQMPAAELRCSFERVVLAPSFYGKYPPEG